jgi:hypothetical protein
LQVDTYVQGVTLTGGSNFLGDNYGVYLVDGTGSDQLVISDSSFNTITAEVYLGAPTGVFIHDNLFILQNNDVKGIDWETAGDGVTIHHNYFQQATATGTVGIHVNTTSAGSSITNNFFRGANTGINRPGALAYDLLIKDNAYSGVATPVDVGASATVILETDTFKPFARTLSCDAAHSGRRAMISDSNTTTLGAVIAGGGANFVVGLCIGASWKVNGV